MNRRLHGSEQTVARLQEVLLACLEEKTFDRITVTELAAKAGIRRTTFYYFYESMDELLQETWRTQLRRALPMLVSFLTRPCTLEEYEQGIHRLMERKMLISAAIQADFGAQEMLSEELSVLLKNTVHISSGENTDALELFSVMYSGCVRAVLEWWVAHGRTADVEMAYALSSGFRSVGIAAALKQLADRQK